MLICYFEAHLSFVIFKILIVYIFASTILTVDFAKMEESNDKIDASIETTSPQDRNAEEEEKDEGTKGNK